MITKFEKDPMTPLYFPFTRIPAGDLKALSLWFSKIARYASSHPTTLADQEAAGLEIHAPLSEDQERFTALYKSCAEWGRLHGLGDHAFAKTIRPERSGDLSEATSSGIRHAIRQQAQPGKDTGKELLLHARLFLQLARDFDGQAEEINRGIGRVATMEAEMLRALMGPLEAGKKASRASRFPAPVEPDPGTHMSAQRLAAWSCLLQHDQNEHGLFITGSRAVLDLILESSPELVKIASLFSAPRTETAQGTNPDCRSMVSASILRLAKAPVGSAEEQVPVPSDCQEISVHMDLYKISDLTPKSFFRRFLGPYSAAVSPPDGPSAITDTLIGFISIG